MDAFIEILVAATPALIEKTGEQLFMVGVAVGLAILVGLPLGILIARVKACRRVVLGFVNVFQTIPSLALLAFLLPFVGIGLTPAIITLTVYALLPIVRSTLVGLQQVPEDCHTACDALGFTGMQRLLLVELPLASPVIVSGIRTATAMSVGIATLAAFIGAGGLGDFINQGLALNSSVLILLGAVPAAMLALMLDAMIGYIEKFLKARQQAKKPIKKPSRFFRYMLYSFAGLGILSASYAVTHNLDMEEDIPTVTIASKNFTEQMILAEIMAQHIETTTNIKVKRRLNLGTSPMTHAALVKGNVDLYPEYLGTAMEVILKQDLHLPAKALQEHVRSAYAKQYHLSWLPSFGFNNSEALMVRQEDAQRLHLNTISDLAAIAPTLRIGAPPEFSKRPDSLPKLQAVYQAHFKDIVQLNTNLMYRAIAHHKVDVIAGFTTDARIKANKLKILKDDKQAYPDYHAAPVVRTAVLQAHPKLADALNQLAHRIDTTTMAQLNYQVDVQKKLPAQVAHDFLLRLHQNA